MGALADFFSGAGLEGWPRTSAASVREVVPDMDVWADGPALVLEVSADGAVERLAVAERPAAGSSAGRAEAARLVAYAKSCASGEPASVVESAGAGAVAVEAGNAAGSAGAESDLRGEPEVAPIVTEEGEPAVAAEAAAAGREVAAWLSHI
jgi:hypothetical protein